MRERLYGQWNAWVNGKLYSLMLNQNNTTKLGNIMLAGKMVYPHLNDNTLTIHGVVFCRNYVSSANILQK